MCRLLPLLLLITLSSPAAVRLKEIASLEGVRENQLVGYGLVVGLNGTGDKRQTMFSAQSLANMLNRMGVGVNAAMLQVRNTAAVMVTSNLPPYAQPGSRIDVHVAAIGDATNLQGGLLVLTPLKAVDGRVFAVAQGGVLTGGYASGRSAGSSVTFNHPTAGRVPEGAIVEVAAPSSVSDQVLRWQLRKADFTTASRVAAAINARFDTKPARSESAATVLVDVPPAQRERLVEFIAAMEELAVEADAIHRVVVNERTGTVVIGRDVPIRPVAIMHGGLSIAVSTTFSAAQPNPLSDGKTVVVPQSNVDAREATANAIDLKPGSTVEDLVRALSAIGSTPRDVVSILQALRAAGALDAQIEVI